MKASVKDAVTSLESVEKSVYSEFLEHAKTLAENHEGGMFLAVFVDCWMNVILLQFIVRYTVHVSFYQSQAAMKRHLVQ